MKETLVTAATQTQRGRKEIEIKDSTLIKKKIAEKTREQDKVTTVILIAEQYREKLR